MVAQHEADRACILSYANSLIQPRDEPLDFDGSPCGHQGYRPDLGSWVLGAYPKAMVARPSGGENSHIREGKSPNYTRVPFGQIWNMDTTESFTSRADER